MMVCILHNPLSRTCTHCARTCVVRSTSGWLAMASTRARIHLTPSESDQQRTRIEQLVNSSAAIRCAALHRGGVGRQAGMQTLESNVASNVFPPCSPVDGAQALGRCGRKLCPCGDPIEGQFLQPTFTFVPSWTRLGSFASGHQPPVGNTVASSSRAWRCQRLPASPQVSHAAQALFNNHATLAGAPLARQQRWSNAEDAASRLCVAQDRA